jgi:hypothetical protein
MLFFLTHHHNFILIVAFDMLYYIWQKVIYFFYRHNAIDICVWNGFQCQKMAIFFSFIHSVISCQSCITIYFAILWHEVAEQRNQSKITKKSIREKKSVKKKRKKLHFFGIEMAKISSSIH